MLDLTAEREKLNKLYRENNQDTVNTLLCGHVGSGKTHTLRTARRPIFIYSFDPGGTKHLRADIEKGYVLVNPLYERHTPTCFTDFALDIQERAKSGFFDYMGTVCIDSLTNFMERVLSAVSKAKNRTQGELMQGDYRVVWIKVVEVINLLINLPCDTVLTAHLYGEPDDMGRKEFRINAPGKAAIALPTLFDEVYIQQAKAGSKEIEYSLQTKSDELYKARTRIGSGLFNTHERPDLMYLREKAGWACKHKELLV